MQTLFGLHTGVCRHFARRQGGTSQGGISAVPKRGEVNDLIEQCSNVCSIR